jgi:hypothetical protein
MRITSHFSEDAFGIYTTPSADEAREVEQRRAAYLKGARERQGEEQDDVATEG